MTQRIRGSARRKTPSPENRTTGRRRKLANATAAPLILLVDDSDDARDMYGLYLVHCGMRVEHAVDGDHGLWKVVMLRPDLVVMDLAMPVLDGWEATRQIKAHPQAKHIPVVVLTGDDTKESLERAHAVGADAVITKPCTPDALHAVVCRLLGR